MAIGYGASMHEGNGAAVARLARMRMTLRAVTALIGGYAAAAGAATLLARILPIARVEATTWAMILSFLLYATLGLWAFHARRLAIVLAVIWSIAAVSFGLAALLGVRP